MEEVKPVNKRYLENSLLLVHPDTTQTPEALAEAKENKEQKGTEASLKREYSINYSLKGEWERERTFCDDRNVLHQ